MSTPTTSPARGLARCLNAPGGITASEACARAAAHLDDMRERALAVIDGGLHEIALLLALGPPTEVARQRIHALSCTTAALGGMFDRAALSKVAYSLCRLLDETKPGWDASAVALHFHAMRLLCRPEQVSADMQASLIEGLSKVRRRIAGEEKPAR